MGWRFLITVFYLVISNCNAISHDDFLRLAIIIAGFVLMLASKWATSDEPETSQKQNHKKSHARQETYNNYRHNTGNGRYQRQTSQNTGSSRENSSSGYNYHSTIHTDYYRDKCLQSLGLAPGASKNDVKIMYYKKIKHCHPDMFQNTPADVKARAEEETKQLNEIYSYLMKYG